jgi:hypothetical protein
MSNRDFSHVTRVQQKSAQTLYAGKAINNLGLKNVTGYIVKGGVPDASVGIATNAGASAAGSIVAAFVANPNRSGNADYAPQ